MKKWLVVINPKPLPGRSLLAEYPKAIELLKIWHGLGISNQRDGKGDFEDWVEQAFRLQSALKAFGENNVFLTTDLKNVINLSTGKKENVSERQDLNRYGVIPDNLYKNDDADFYMETKTFKDNAKRKIKLCGFNVENDIIQASEVFFQQGIKNVYVKTKNPKSGLWNINLSKDCRQSLFEEMDWSLVQYEGVENAFLLQEAVSMFYEYRLFVVDNKIVTGAGCIEEFTPLQNQNKFDKKVRKHRQNKTQVKDNPKVVESLVQFSTNVVKTWQEEQPHIKNYVLDVALNEYDEPLVIERNSLPNSGLYASSPLLVAKALNAC